MTIVEFLTARLDEDEAIARAARSGTACSDWSVVPYVYGPRDEGWGDPVPEVHATDGAEVVYHQAHEGGGVRDLPTAEHIARHDPARVLADVASKREIVRLLDEYDYLENINADPNGFISTPVLIARHLAAVYSDHPDYLPEWAL